MDYRQIYTAMDHLSFFQWYATQEDAEAFDIVLMLDFSSMYRVPPS